MANTAIILPANYYKKVTTDTTMIPFLGYVTNSGAQLNMSLPTTMEFGQTFGLVAYGAGGWKVVQPANTFIIIGSNVTTTGAAGYISCTAKGVCVYLVVVDDAGGNYTLEVISENGGTIYWN